VQADVTAGLADVLSVKSKDQLEATRAGGALAVQVALSFALSLTLSLTLTRQIPNVFAALI